jgi:dihydrodipicolinate synthase/N-acetylneuraminate lyase
VFKIIEGDRAKLEVKLIEAILLGNLEEAERISVKLRPLPKALLRPIQNLIKENNLL